MNMQYDKKVDVVYIELAKGRYSKTRKISDVILVDEDKKGKVLGIEILDATKNITAFDPQKTKLSIQAAQIG